MDLLRKIFRGDRVVWIIYGLLCVISIIEVFSAASTLTFKSGNHWLPIRHHIITLAIGFLAVIFFQYVNLNSIRKIGLYIFYPTSFILLIVVILISFYTGEKVNDAARWLDIFGFQFQPSELAKLSVIILTAHCLTKYKESDGKPGTKALLIIAALTLPVCFLIFSENLSTTLLIGLVVYLMLFLGRLNTRLFLKITTVGLLLATLLLSVIMLTPTQKKNKESNTIEISFLPSRLSTWKSRILTFFDNEYIPPEKYDVDKNGQIAHANIAIASSKGIGKGPGNSTQRDFLSQAFSDFIYAIIIEEFGLFFGAALVIVLYLWLFMRVGRIAHNCQHTFPTLLVMGIALMIVTQAFINMLVAVNLIPVTGQPLPLISKGGSSSLINSAYIGIILSVSRYTKLIEQQDKIKETQEIGVEANAIIEDLPLEIDLSIDHTEKTIKMEEHE